MDQTIVNPLGETLDYTFSPGTAENKKEGWIILLGHGVTGNKDRPVITDTARALNAAGFDTLGFSFAGNGDSGGDFRGSTISKEVGDLAAVIDAVALSYRKIGYIGHSMGAAVGVLRTATDPRLSALVSLAGMVATRTFAETEFGSETPDVGLMWEEESCPLSSAFMQDLCETIGSVAPQAAAVTVPWLLLHGTADDVVLPRDTELIRDLRGESVTVVWVEGADHSFSLPAHKSAMLEAVVPWLLDLVTSGPGT